MYVTWLRDEGEGEGGSCIIWGGTGLRYMTLGRRGVTHKHELQTTARTKQLAELGLFYINHALPASPSFTRTYTNSTDARHYAIC